MKVAILVPPSPFLMEPLTFPPLGPLYLSAYLKKQGHDVVVYDYDDYGQRTHEKRWDKVEKADVIGETGTTPQFKDMVHFLQSIKKREYGKDKIFVAGGPHASSDPRSCLDYGFDSVVLGDGELAFQEVLQCNLKGFHSHKVTNLDALPFPDRSAINIKKYHYKIDGLEATSLITQRGCPYACAFCCHWEGYRGVRFRSPENVVEEIEQVRSLYDYEAFMFWDDEFNLDRARTLKLCEALKPLEIKFRCFIRSNLFDAEVGHAMKEAGCVEVGCGVESASQRILDVIGKRTTVFGNTMTRKVCRMLGIRFKAFTIIGLPSEDEKSVEETREWLRKNEPDDFDITINTPFPGSPQWKHPERYDLIFDKEGMRKALYEGTFYKGPPKSPVATSHLSAQRIVQLRDEIEDEFKRKVKSRELWQDRPIA